MPTLTCVHCDRVFDSLHIVNCVICRKHYGNSCIGITSSELRLINSGKGCDWTCTACRSYGNDIKDLKAIIISLKDEVQLLKEAQASVLQKNTPNAENDYEDMIAEINERNKRKSNLIIYRVVESDQLQSHEARTKKDFNEIKSILNSISADIQLPSGRKPIRLGQFQENKIRPIKITLSDESEVHKVIKKFKIVQRNNPALQNISVSFDRTKRQIDHFKKLKTELENRNSENETFKIQYFHGVPKIVPVN